MKNIAQTDGSPARRKMALKITKTTSNAKKFNSGLEGKVKMGGKVKNFDGVEKKFSKIDSK